MRRLIIFLVRKKLGLKKEQLFRFANQKNNATYWFTSDSIIKCENSATELSGVSLNWLLDKNCEIVKMSGGSSWLTTQMKN